MNQTDFIQRASIALFNPAEPDVDKAIAYAERLWHRLGERGYGAAKKHEPNTTKDYYAELSTCKRNAFDKFWQAYNHKQGRNGAAMRWGQIPVSEHGDFEAIIAAAKADALKPRPNGSSRKMAQGWLAEKRWLDATPAKANAQANEQLERSIKRNELASLKQLYTAQPNNGLALQIAELEKQLGLSSNTNPVHPEPVEGPPTTPGETE